MLDALSLISIATAPAASIVCQACFVPHSAAENAWQLHDGPCCPCAAVTLQTPWCVSKHFVQAL